MKSRLKSNRSVKLIIFVEIFPVRNLRNYVTAYEVVVIWCDTFSPCFLRIIFETWKARDTLTRYWKQDQLCRKTAARMFRANKYQISYVWHESCWYLGFINFVFLGKIAIKRAKLIGEEKDEILQQIFNKFLKKSNEQFD